MKPYLIHKGAIPTVFQFGPTKSPSKDLVSPPKMKRCGKCETCLLKDCGECVACVDKPRFGGPGIKKKGCLRRE